MTYTGISGYALVTVLPEVHQTISACAVRHQHKDIPLGMDPAGVQSHPLLVGADAEALCLPSRSVAWLVVVPILSFIAIITITEDIHWFAVWQPLEFPATIGTQFILG